MGVAKISGPKRSIKIIDHFTCTSANVIYCITCTYCNKFYIGETGRRLGDRFREHLRDVERNDKDASEPVARHFNLPNQRAFLMTTSKRSKRVILRTALHCGSCICVSIVFYCHMWLLWYNFDPSLSRETCCQLRMCRIIYAYVMNYTLWSCWSPNVTRRRKK